MGEDMWRLWFTKLLLLAILLLAVHAETRSRDEGSLAEIKAPRIERDLEGVTTVLLVSARPGKSVPPVGLLTKTARTFVQDGASTEFATQVVGTTLDNGRLYARILSTSSRVFYEKDPTPDSATPYVVYPSRTPSDDWQLKVALDNAPIKALKDIDDAKDEGDDEKSLEDSEKAATKLDEFSRENDIFSRREPNSDPQRFKPAKVRPADNLPTYTVKHEYVGSGLDNFEDEQPKSFRPRVPKIFKPQAKAPVQKKLDTKPLATVTYHGFADFTTTVGETVIVFSPSTSPAPAGRPATTIKGDATLRPDDGVAVAEIRPTSVVASQEKTTQHPGRKSDPRSETGDPLLDAINRANIQPSVTEDFELESATTSTEPLLLVPEVETASSKPTGLLKVLDSTTSKDGITTHYKSLIYGTYIGTNYAQIIHTSSNVYFFPDEATASYDTGDTTVDYGTTGTEETETDQGTTFEMTTGTTPRMITTSEEAPPEMNELTTPIRDTTDSVLTTLKDILESARRILGTTESASPTLDDDIPNDIVPGDPQGRSIKGGSSKNNLGHKDGKENGFREQEEKVTLATKLLPSTVYKTFTYFTTFFVPDGHQTTTSIRSREVVSSEVSYLTELVVPTATVTPVLPTAAIEPQKTQTTPSFVSAVEEEQSTKQDEEIELIFKTLYTTYTYLTTFFQESTSSISSREVVETNVITQTVGPNGVSAVVAGLFEKDESTLIAPTKIADRILPSTTPEQEERTEKYPTTIDQTTEDTLTTLQEQDTTTDHNIPTEPAVNRDFEDTRQTVPEIEPSPTPALPTQQVKEQIKTYYTTYTYFTTIFVDDETEIETRTEVFTNVVTETIQPTAVVPAIQETLQPTTPKEDPAAKPAVPPEILAYLEAIQRQKSQEEALLLAKKVQQQGTTPEEAATVPELKTETTAEYPSTQESTTEKIDLFRGFEVDAQVTPNPPMEGEVLGSMVTDVVSSSSSGGGTLLDVMDKRNAVPEDQELSESNHHDVEPAPTLLLQTSYTTFTYFTTMYKGDESNVASRLETVTNVVTETIRPTAVVPMETSTLPVTYFTTFTYWTTFYKGGDTVTTSREETVSNVMTPGVAPSPTVELGVVMTYRPEDSSADGKESKITADNEVTPSVVYPTDNVKTEELGTTVKNIATTPNEQSSLNSTTISPEPVTYYTTYTYFTTSYIGNETILNSRLETVTSVSIPEVVATPQLATGRAIDGPIYQQTLATEEKPVTPSKSSEPPKIGLISTVRSSLVNDGTTTHYLTDVHGTYIDGLYAQVVESSTRIETPTLPPSSTATPVLPTGVLSMNKGSVIDADEVTTIYFTTKQIGTQLNDLYAKVIESTSSTKIDEERKATIPPTQGHRTGLVRLIQGQIENNGTTIFYQSKVIGTSIDGRYAQIIESTSSFLSSTPTINIAPTSTLPPTKPTEVPEISPSPAVIQSSLPEDPTTESPDQDDSEQNEESEEKTDDEDGQSSKKKSRLTFSTRKRTFTPAIRPFDSRSRPTFNPKRKGAQGATTITRSDVTPTITATLAGKGNRFASSRGRISSPIGPYSSTLSPSGSRRFAGRRGSPTTASSYASTIGSTRGRPQSRISPSSVLNRRGPTSIRGSSARAATRGSSSIYPGTSSRYRPPIRASSTLLRGQPTVRHDDQENDANEFTTTTLMTDDTLYTDDAEGGETVTTPLQTTTESSRRSTNPLLRFRRPINLNSSGRTGTTPRPPTTTRRNGNLNRSTPPPVPRVSNVRANARTSSPISTRPRQSSTGLFPPRGLFGKKQELPTEEQIEPNEDLEGEGEENFEDDPVDEITDNDYEGSEHEDRTTSTSVNRRSGKSIRPTVQIRPFTRLRRTRRQASQLRSLTNRFRRPSQLGTKAEDKADVMESASNKEETTKSTSKPIARYNNRGRSLTTSRSASKSSNNPEKTSAESTEGGQSKPRNRKQSNGDRSTSSRIKPSPTSGNGRQFTLREKEGSSASRSNYKRPSSSASRSTSRTTSNSERVRPPRLRNNSNKSAESTSSRRVPPSRASSRPSSRSGSKRGSSSQRQRGSREDIREAPTVYPDYDGTITVTHYVPTEVTIPVVNNGITEHRNIITAQPSTEVLAPSQYSTVTGGDGRSLVVIVSEVTGTNIQGQTEVTRFLLHESPTTRVSHTLATLGGRRASQSVIVPTTVYSVENVVSTIQPSLPENAPLANILLSQLLLGQLGQANPLLQPQGAPSTQYNTRTTSYVTTITKQQSTVIPLTFRGKEILTTLVDTSTDVITATEFITDTVVVTPTAALPAANLNSLLLLLQQPQPPKNPNPLLDPVFAAPPFTQSNTLPGEVERRHQPVDSDYKHDSYEYSEEEDEVQEYHKSSKPFKSSKPRNSRGKYEKKDNHSSTQKEESSVVTLYVSGRRPGEFSTVLSTVKVSETASSSRRRRHTGQDDHVEVRASIPPSLNAGPEEVTILASSEDSMDAHAPTQSLESVVDDYPHDYQISDPDNLHESPNDRSKDLTETGDDYAEETPRKRVRIRVPVVRKNGRQHKLTVVRRRPLPPRTHDPSPLTVASHTPRRIVVTRVRTLGLANSIQTESEPDTFRPEIGRHKVTITRRRKLESSTVTPSTIETKARITRKKLVAVRPIQPTSSFAIITTGFFTASSEYDEEYAEEEDEEEENKQEVSSTSTPELKEPPNVIDSKPEDLETEDKTEETASKVVEETTASAPVIITDNFFFPPSDDEYGEYEEYTETSTTENIKETMDDDVSTTTKSPDTEDDISSRKEDTTTEAPIVAEKEETTTEMIDYASHETTTDKSDKSSTATESTEVEEDEKSIEEETPTTKNFEIEEEDEQEDQRTTTVEPVETTDVNVFEEQFETTVLPDEEVTTLGEEETYSSSEYPEADDSETLTEPTDSEDSIEKDVQSHVTTVPTKVEDSSTNDDEDSFEKEIESHKVDDSHKKIEPDATIIESKDPEDSPEKIEPQVTVSQTESEGSSSKDPEDRVNIQPQITVIESSKDSERTLKMIEPQIVITQTESKDSSSKYSEDSVKDSHTIIPSLEPEVERSSTDTLNLDKQTSETVPKPEEKVEISTVQPIVEPSSTSSPVSPSSFDVSSTFASVLPLETSRSTSQDTSVPNLFDDTEIPSVIPLEVDYTPSESKRTTLVLEATPSLGSSKVTTSITSPTPEDIEAGLADDLYLSLSRPDFPEILPSKPSTEVHETESTPDLEPSTSVYYTETVVTSTRLRTYTYVVTQLNGLETKVTSSTTVRPRVTTLTLTVPITVTVTPTVESTKPVSSVYSPVPVAGEYEAKDEEGRRFNLATRVMSNGVEVIVAGPTPALRWENSMPQPTLTLSDTVVMMLPQDKPNEFVTKTCTTTFTYLTTITKDGTTTVSTEQQVIANTATEERHRKPGSETAAVTLDASPTLRTEVFKTTYTYLTLNTDHSNIDDALESSTKVITNTVTAPQHYLHMILEPSEAPRPETNTYLSTRMLEKTFMEDGRTRIETTSDTVTQLIITESAPPPRPTSVTTTLTALDSTEESMTDATKTYYITYTYYNTFLEKGSTVVRTNVATSTDIVLEKVPVKKTTTKTTLVNPTPEPIQIFATKTYLTTFTYFTTLLQAGPDGETSTTVSSRSHIVENVVTESIAPSLLDAGYMNALLTTAHHSDSVKNVVTGSTIIFFDEEDQIDPTTSSSFPEATTVMEVQKDEAVSTSLASTEASSVVNEQNSKPSEQINQEQNATTSDETVQNKKPASQNTSDLQVSNLLSLGSLGINSLSALGPVITAMAGLLQGKTTATRRNDTIPHAEVQEVTTQRAPIYIPVAEFADGDIEAAESQNIGTHLANLNHNYIETRHKVASSLADGIPISPGEVITANSDVIIGKPGRMAPRPPQTFLEDEEHIGMKPPPMPVPNIPVHPVLEVLENDRDDSQPQQTLQGHKGPQIQIYPAHQVYEEHLKIPVSMPIDSNPSLIHKQSQKLHSIQSSPPKRMGSKQDVLENDPLLKPPDRPNVEQYANPNLKLNEPEWSPEKPRRPWSSKDPLKLSPSHPQFDQKIDSVKPPMEKPWPTIISEEQKRPPWAQRDPLLPDTSIVIQSSESKSKPAEPIVHQVPHVIDRSTGQPLLVNIQPSQVANVVIPQGGTQALIFGDTNEPHISGQTFDDPSPYPESEVGLGFLGIQRVEDLPQYSIGKDPADYMVPPSPPVNFRTSPEKHPSSNRPAVIPLSPGRFDYDRPQDKLEAPVGRPGKKPSDVHVIQHSDGSSGQGHVHTEILVHHRPETVNIRPQAPHPTHVHSNLPQRGQFPKLPKPADSNTPPRRTEMSNSPDNAHRYILLAKPDSGNEILLNNNWTPDKKPPRILINNRIRPRPPFRSTTSRPLDRPIYVERPNVRKPVYSGPQRPLTKNPNMSTFVLPHRPLTNPQIHHEPPAVATAVSGDGLKEAVTERQPSFGPRPQHIDLQDRPLHFYPENRRPTNVVQVRPQTERTEEHLPTGAVEYHNPSKPKIKSESTKPGVNTQDFDQTLSDQQGKPETWQSGTQTEKTLDSETEATEHVKLHDKKIQKVDEAKEDTVVSQNNNTAKNPYVQKPSGHEYQQHQNEKPVWISQGAPFTHKNVATSTQSPYGPNYYNIKLHEMPIVQGKPFGVYSGHEDAVSYGYKWKEGKPDYEIVQGVPSTYYGTQKPSVNHKNQQGERTSTPQPHERDDTIDLKPPAIIPQFTPDSDKPGRPYPRPTAAETRPVLYPRPEIPTQTPEARPDQSTDDKPATLDSFLNDSAPQGSKVNQSHLQLGGFVDLNWNSDGKLSETQKNKTETVKTQIRNGTNSQQSEEQYPQSDMEAVQPENNHPMLSQQEYGPGTRIHPEYPHIITKPKPQVPGPITISSGHGKPETRPNIRFSLPVEATGEEVDSKTQTERPPSMLITKNDSNDKKKNDESLETSYQTNFALSDANNDESTNIRIRPVETSTVDMLGKVEGMSIPSRDMMPPPLRPAIGSNQSNKNEEEDLKPPPIPSRDVFGLSPPPVDITTTSRPTEDRFSFGVANESGLKPPPKYIPLEDSSVAPLPSVTMVPPSPRPSVARPFIVELLSQDMVPPPPATQTTRPLEIATVRPAVAVSGSIQIATAVATSHIPVVQDMESKIPIIHGTVDLPVVVDVPEILRPVETKMTEHVSIYTVRPFDTRPVSRISVQPTAVLTTNMVIPTKLRPLQVNHIQPSRSSSTSRDVEPTRSQNFEIPPNPVKRPEHPVFLESSHDNVLPSTKVEPTESLTQVVITSQKKEPRPTMIKDDSTKLVVFHTTERNQKNETTVKESSTVVTTTDSPIVKATSTPSRNNDRTNGSIIKMTKSVVSSTVRKTVNGSTTAIRTKPKEVTRFQTSTVTRTETSVLGSPPTTRTLLLTHTMTSTTVETVTETLLRPTSVISTVTSTILQPVVTRIPSSYENVADNDSIFVVLSDQKPPEPGAEEVEAEYGDDISRDEQDPVGNEVHRVLAGGVLGAPVESLQPIPNQCAPECRASRAEMCTEVGNEMRCVCRPGFARMFPDRPCKPTYTYTLRVGLDRIGHEPVNYEVGLNDSASAAHRRLLSPIKDALDRTLMQSDLRDIYRGLKIVGFSPNPTKVEFHVQLSDNANETRLKEVLRKYLVSSNYSLGGTEVYASKNLDVIDAIDFDECATEEDGPHHDCSSNAACFNLRGSYQCSCKEGWADLSENPTYPGRVCSQAPLGCPSCNNKGHCVTNTNGQEVCECFPWHSGQRCQVNLKVLLIALVTTGVILLGLLAVCVGMACFRQPGRRRKTGDRRAMIPGTGGDTSSEGSVTDLAIPHHVPHVLPPPPQMIAPLPPSKRPARKISGKPRHPPRKATMVPASVPVNDEQRDRSLTVMIPRAKYRSAPQSPQNYKTGMSTFSTEEHKLLSYLDSGTHNTGNRKQSVSSAKDCKETEVQVIRTPAAPAGALVSAGFQVSATVTRTMDADSTLARSCGETTVEAATKVLRTGDLQGDLCSTLARSCGETTIQAPTKLLRLDLGEAGSTLARSCGETTIQPPTKVADARRNSVKDNRDTRDSASEGHTMAERDLGSTLRLPAQHPPLYSPDRTSDRESNFDSL